MPLLQRSKAEEKVQPLVADVRVALDVEEDVGLSGLWQHLEAKLGPWWRNDPVLGLAGATPEHLHRSLILKAFEGDTWYANNLASRILGAEGGECCDAISVELLDLDVSNTRDQTQMIIGASTVDAVPPPPADLTMLDGIGIGRTRGGNEFVKGAVDCAVVGGVVVHLERLHGVVAEDQVHPLGCGAL